MDAPRAGRGPSALLVGLLVAVAASLATRHLGLWAGAVAGAAAVVYSVRAGRPGPWLLALPAALAAVAPPPQPVDWPRPGPVRVEGTVQLGIRRDPPAATTLFRIARGGAEVLCISQGLPDLLPGDRVTGVGRLRPQPERRRRGLLPQVQLVSDGLQREAGPPSLARLAVRARHRLQDSLLEHYRGREALLLTSLVLGRGIRLPEELSEAHRATGLSHLLAVSGAHATILAWVLAALWGAWAGRRPVGLRSFRWACVAVLLSYGAITGLEPPVFRALAAWILALVAGARGRRITLAGALGLPALLTLVVAPQDLGDVGLLLSYAAVFGLSLGAGPRSGRLGRLVVAPMVASFWATVTTAPITLWVFDQLAPWTILATPLLAPLVVVMLAGGLLSAVLGCLAAAPAAWLASPVQGVTWLYCQLVEALATLPGTPILARTEPGFWELAAAVATAALAIVLLRNRWGVLLGCTCLCLPHLLPAGDAGPSRLQLFAVGHGQACLMHMPEGSQVLVDCGSLGNPARAARQVAEGIGRRRTIDLLVVTHGDVDHAGGIGALLQRVPVRRAVLPAALAGSEPARALARAGAAVTVAAPGARLEPVPGLQVAAPRVPQGSTNDRSLWVRADLSGFAALVTGDAEGPGTRAWLASPQAGPADVLVLPHHGRRNDAAEALLDAVDPTLALVSNRDTEAGTEQGELAGQRGIRVLHTSRVGAITVLDGAPPVVRTERPAPLW